MAFLRNPFKALFGAWVFAHAESGSDEERRALREVTLEQLGLAQWAGFTHL